MERVPRFPWLEQPVDQFVGLSQGRRTRAENPTPLYLVGKAGKKKGVFGVWCRRGRSGIAFGQPQPDNHEQKTQCRAPERSG